GRVLDLEPVPTATRRVYPAQPLRDDPLKAELAGVGEHESEQWASRLDVKNYVTSHLSGVCKGASFAVPISSQNGAPKVHTAIEGTFCKVTSTVGVIFFSLSAFESVSESVDVALTSYPCT